jgi:ABC-type antimicrobial peptide transport system permease subunit
MRAMWERRLLSATVTMLLAAIAAVLEVEGYALFLAIVVIVPVAMLAGFGAEAWINDRKHRSLG